jgi:Phosphate transporter family
MADVALQTHAGTGAVSVRPKLDRGFQPRTIIMFLLLLGAGLFFVAYSLYSDVQASGARATTFLPYLLLFVALLIALGFEFVNGFHDTANAVATVIYTHSLPAEVAVVWSGSFNFLGVLLSSGAVAYGIISLLPVELILQVGSSAGFAMVFALLIAAIIWTKRHFRGRLGPSYQCRQGVAVFTRCRVHPLGDFAARHEGLGATARVVSRAGDGQATCMVDPWLAGVHLHRRQLRPWLE